jgi:DNA-binding NtrC family response regulator
MIFSIRILNFIFQVNNSKAIRIFWLDDDIFCSKIYEHHLRVLGYYNIKLFQEANACLKALPQRPDVVFLDHNLPGTNGQQVLTQIQELSPHTKVVYFTGKQMLNLEMEVRNAGVYAFIQKGVGDLAHLTAVMTMLEKESYLPIIT